jgi:D-3-phosphoglycerate dehydrogenase
MAKFKVVGLGKLGGAGMDIEVRELAKAGVDAEVIAGRYATEDELLAQAGDADVILGGGPWFSRRVIEKLTKCRAIITYSVGFDGIDVQAATEAGILVVNNPAAEWCVEEVANHAIVLLLDCAKRISALNDYTKRGLWRETRQILAGAPGIHEQTLGLIGCGGIGRAVAEKAHAFHLTTIGYDPYPNQAASSKAGIKLMSMNEVLAQSDFVSLHTPLSAETRHLIGEPQLRLMKPTAYLINTARGPVVDEPALIRALQEKRIAGAGLDVFEKEPVDPNNPLLKMDNVVVTPHSASSSIAAIAVQAVNPSQEAARVLSGTWPHNPVNPSVKPRVKLEKEQ